MSDRGRRTGRAAELVVSADLSGSGAGLVVHLVELDLQAPPPEARITGSGISSAPFVRGLGAWPRALLGKFRYSRGT